MTRPYRSARDVSFQATATSLPQPPAATNGHLPSLLNPARSAPLPTISKLSVIILHHLETTARTKSKIRRRKGRKPSILSLTPIGLKMLAGRSSLAAIAVLLLLASDLCSGSNGPSPAPSPSPATKRPSHAPTPGVAAPKSSAPSPTPAPSEPPASPPPPASSAPKISPAPATAPATPPAATRAPGSAPAASPTLVGSPPDESPAAPPAATTPPTGAPALTPEGATPPTGEAPPPAETPEPGTIPSSSATPAFSPEAATGSPPSAVSAGSSRDTAPAPVGDDSGSSAAQIGLLLLCGGLAILAATAIL